MEPTSLFSDGKTLDALEKIKTREEIEVLVPKEILLHATDRLKNTMLHKAVRWKNTILAKYLIDSGCTINAKNDLGQTPLVLAIGKNCEEIVEILINAGDEINVQDNDDKNILQIIGECDWQSTKMSQSLMKKLQLDCLNNKENVATKLSKAGWSLHNIVRLNDVSLTELLLQRGYASYIDKTNLSGQTALHVAVKSVDVEHVNLLINYNANVDILDYEERTAFSYVYDGKDENSSERLSILKMLLDRSTNLGNIYKTPNIFTYASKEAMNLLFNTYNLGLLESAEKLFLLPALVANKNPGILEALRGRDYFANVTSYSTQLMCSIVILRSASAETAEFLMKELLNVCNESNFPSMLVCILGFLSTNEPPYDGFDEQCKICVRTFFEYGVNVQLKDTNIGGSSILEMIINKNLFAFGKLVLSHVAFQEANGTSVTALSRLKINANNQFKTYFESSQQRLKTKIYGSITLFDLLTMSEKKLELYVRNQVLLSKIQDTVTVLSEYEYYQILLQKRFTLAIAIVALKKEAALIICKIMGTSYDTFPFIVDIIINYLEQQDM